MEPSVLALRNVPIKWSMKEVVATLTPIIKAQFTVSSFDNEKGNSKGKIAYIRLPSHLDANVVLQKIERVQTKGDWYMYGFVPESVPQSALEKKGKSIGKKLASKHKIDVVTRPEIHCRRTVTELVREIQTKYLGLFKLSSNHNHELLDAISETMIERLTVIVKSFSEPQTGFNLGKAYRARHPHGTDFNLIMTTLHRIEDGKRRPYSEITQTELLAVPTIAPTSTATEAPPSAALQAATLNAAALRYLHPISDKVIAHIVSLDTDLPQDNEDQRATIRVREELKKLTPYVSEVIREAVVKHLSPRGAHYKACHMRIYGEPYMPSRDACTALMQKLNARGVMRSKYLFNLLMLSVNPGNHDAFMKTDGSMLGGAKLTCRPSEVPLYKVRPAILDKINAFYGIPGQADAASGDEDYDVMECDDDGEESGDGEEQ